MTRVEVLRIVRAIYLGGYSDAMNNVTGDDKAGRNDDLCALAVQYFEVDEESEALIRRVEAGNEG